MKFSIHQVILIRLAPAWLLLSLTVGGAVYRVESYRVGR